MPKTPDTGYDAAKILEVFQAYDANKDGFIVFDELSAVLQRLDPKWTATRLRRLLREADANLDGKIDYGEFVAYLTTGTTSNWCRTAVMEATAKAKDLKLSVEDAENLIRGLKPSDWSVFASSCDADEHLVMCVMLAYLECDDTTWANAEVYLNDPFRLLTSLFEAEVGERLTIDAIRRADSLGIIQIGQLRPGSAAWVLAHYLTACLSSAKRRLGIEEGSHLPASAEGGAPKWPIKIELKDLQKSLHEAARWQKTSLVVCNGMEREVDQFFRYRNFLRIDAKRILVETTMSKKKNVEEVRAEIREVIVAAMKADLPLHICMGTTAVRLRDEICADGTFPKSLFNPRLWNNKERPEENREYMTILNEAEREESLLWQGGPGKLGPGFFVVVTSDFDKEDAIEHLPPTLPYLSEMAIIEVDPPRGGSWSWAGEEVERRKRGSA